MLKIGEFIYPWGGGHYSRMMRLNSILDKHIKEKFELHYSSKDHVYQKLLEKFPNNKDQIHEILMPTPIDGKFGPSISLSLLNLVFPISKNPPLLKQIASYLRKESKLYDKEKFDLVINDGDMVCVTSPRGKVDIKARITDEVKPGILSTTFHFPEVMLNIITSDEHDSVALCPEYKVVAVNIRKSKGIYKEQTV